MFLQKTKGAHYHKWHVDGYTGDRVCLCGVTKGQDEKIKYHNYSTIYNGICYDSGLEARHAAELDILLKAGQIKGWERQVRLDLKVRGQHICNYYIDFVVTHNDNSREYQELKGLVLPVWRLKFKIFEAIFEDFKQGPDDRITVIKEASKRKVVIKKRVV